MEPENDDFQDSIRAARDHYLAGANYLAAAINSAPEGYDTEYLWRCMDKGREMADAFDPPPKDFGGPNVVPLDMYRRRG